MTTNPNPTQPYKLTMDHVYAAANRRAETGEVLVRVDSDLQDYLFKVAHQLMKCKNATEVCATLHTLLEVGIETGRALGREECGTDDMDGPGSVAFDG